MGQYEVYLPLIQVPALIMRARQVMEEIEQERQANLRTIMAQDQME